MNLRTISKYWNGSHCVGSLAFQNRSTIGNNQERVEQLRAFYVCAGYYAVCSYRLSVDDCRQIYFKVNVYVTLTVLASVLLLIHQFIQRAMFSKSWTYLLQRPACCCQSPVKPTHPYFHPSLAIGNCKHMYCH